MISKLTIAAARKNANLTQGDLAEKCGVSTSTVFNWENRKSIPSVKYAYMIADAVGLNIDDIIFL